MKTSKVIFSILTLSAILFSQSGCKKDSDNSGNPPADSKTSVTDNALAENLYNNVKDWSDQAMAGSMLKSTLTDTVFQGTCVLATLDTVASTWVLTIDFGSSNCKCADSMYRRGKIICTFTGSYWALGTVITFTFDNYFVNDNQVLGTKIVTNKGLNSSNNLWWEIKEDGSIIKANNGGTITWISTRQLEWTEGRNTLWVWWDDVYQVTGEAHGVNSSGDDYQYNITTPLKKKLNCQWIVSGVMTLQVTGLPLITMDYGDGTCNNIADVIINGQTYQITLP
jgi:hypothetical protein